MEQGRQYCNHSLTFGLIFFMYERENADELVIPFQLQQL